MRQISCVSILFISHWLIAEKTHQLIFTQNTTIHFTWKKCSRRHKLCILLTCSRLVTAMSRLRQLLKSCCRPHKRKQTWSDCLSYCTSMSAHIWIDNVDFLFLFSAYKFSNHVIERCCVTADWATCIGALQVADNPDGKASSESTMHQ